MSVPSPQGNEMKNIQGRWGKGGRERKMSRFKTVLIISSLVFF